MRTRSVAVLVAGILAVLLSACAGGQGGEQAGDPELTDTPSLSPVTPAPSPTDSPPVVPAPSEEPTGKPGLTTLTGEVFAGVEAGCLLLQTSTGDYLLIGEVAGQMQTGSTVTVRGQVRTNLATTCQQGTPFEVTEVLD